MLSWAAGSAFHQQLSKKFPASREVDKAFSRSNQRGTILGCCMSSPTAMHVSHDEDPFLTQRALMSAQTIALAVLIQCPDAIRGSVAALE